MREGPLGSRPPKGMIIYLGGGSRPPQVDDHPPGGGEGRACIDHPLPGSDVRPLLHGSRCYMVLLYNIMFHRLQKGSHWDQLMGG